MSIRVPDEVVDNMIDDIETIDHDINSLYNRFIVPIDAVRSYAIKPNVSINNISTQRNNGFVSITELIINESKDIEINATEPSESRCHAFYRMLGLPVVAMDGSYFNPGFNPIPNSKFREKQVYVSKNIDPNVLDLSNYRENDVKQRSLIFKKQNIDSTIYTLALRFIKKFNNLDSSMLDNPFALDMQKFSVDDRKYAFENIKKPDGSPIDKFFESGRHILKPFVVDPIIDETVTPGKNKICVPFLKNKAETKLEGNVYLLRPVIERILRIRLKQRANPKEIEKQFLESLMNDSYIKREFEIRDDEIDIRKIVFDLLDKSNINFSDYELISGITSDISFVMTVNLIKVINAVIKELNYSINVINHILNDSENGINWFPLPKEKGPEYGTEMARLVRSDNNTKLESRILNLQIKKTSSSLNQQSDDQNSLGNFALFSGENNAYKYDNELNQLISKRNQLGNYASIAVRNIEIITGEISGLGLIDILAIYTALWAIDLNTLISLLDDDSFDRLYKYNKHLISEEVENRKNKGESIVPIKEALKNLEKRISSILTYADSLVAHKLESPVVSDSGMPGGT